MEYLASYASTSASTLSGYVYVTGYLKNNFHKYLLMLVSKTILVFDFFS
jgi:hypothetical protein